MVSIFRRTRRGAALAALTISLALPALAAVATSEASAEIPAASGPADSSAEAAQRAQASGDAVEDLSQRSETTRVFANPDGTWRQETFADPVRVEDADGDWHTLDTTLVSSGDGFAPKYALTDVVISGGGDSEFATLTEDGHTVAFSWGDDLPEPVIDGDTATYEDVAPGQDLIVKALPGGFEHSLVLHEQPEGDVDFTTGVSVDGAKIAETSDGGAVVKAVNGDVVATIEQPVVYDSDDASRPVPAEAELTGTPASGQEITVTAEEEYLSDPGTEYPVTIDPVVQVFTSGDTWIQNNSTTNQGTNPELRVGTNNSGSTIARAYIDFPDQNWSGKQIQSADLVMYNTYSANCTSLAINASRITQPWGFTTISWPGPTAGANTAGFSTAYGAPSGSCGGGGYTHFDVTGILNAWNSGQPNYGIRLMASNEQSNNSFRKYYSANYTAAPTSAPHINVTYRSVPTISVSPCPNCDPDDLFTTSLTPTLTATSNDFDSVTLTYNWSVARENSDALAYSTTTTSPAHTPSSITLPAGVAVDEIGLDVRVVVTDGSGSVDGGWTRIAVDANDVPSVPAEMSLSPCPGNCEALVSSTETPTVAARVEDPDAPVVDAQLEVRRAGGTNVVYTASIDGAASGTEAVFPIPQGHLQNGSDYQFRVSASDGTVVWSPWSDFKVRVPNGIGAPEDLRLITCSGPCTDWHSTTVEPTFVATNPTANGAGSLVFQVSDGEFTVGGSVSVAAANSGSWTVPSGQLTDGASWLVRVGFAQSSTTVWGAWMPFSINDDALGAVSFPSSEEVPGEPTVVDPSDPVVEDPPAITASQAAYEYSQAEEALAADEESSNYRQVPYYSDALRTVSLARQYAPVVYLHPNETQWPMNASTFIAHSALRWKHDGHESTHTIAGLGKISSSKLGGKGVGPYSHRVFCLMDYNSETCADSGSVWKNSTDLVRPFEAEDPVGKQGNGMYMNLDNAYKHGRGFQRNEKMYYYTYDIDVNRSRPGGQRRRILYWFHYGMSTTALANHEGDWESIGIEFDKNTGVPIQVAFNQHGGGCRVPWRLVTTLKTLGYSGSTAKYRPLVLSAKGTHASYPFNGVAAWYDKISSNGEKWYPTNNNVVNVQSEPWFGYGGGWGAVGNGGTFIKSKEVTGPLGPSPYKTSAPFNGRRCAGY